MSRVFKKHCDEFFAQDVPFDAGSLEAVADNQKAIFDTVTPVVSKNFFYELFDATEDFQEWASVEKKCMFVRPYLLTPGLKEIKIHIYGSAYHWSGSPEGEAIPTAVWIYGGEGAQASTVEGVVTSVLEDGGTFSFTTITVPVRQVVRPEITLIQVWLASSHDPAPAHAPVLGSDLGDLRTKIDWTNVNMNQYYFTDSSPLETYTSAGMEIHPNRHAIGYFENATGVFRDPQTLVNARSKDTVHTYLTLNYLPNISYNKATYTDGGFKKLDLGIADCSYYQVKSIAFEEVREDSETYLDTAVPESKIPGNLTEAECVSGFVGADASNRKSPRALTMGIGLGCGATFRPFNTSVYTVPVLVEAYRNRLETYYVLNRIVDDYQPLRVEENLEIKMSLIASDGTVVDYVVREVRFLESSSRRDNSLVWSSESPGEWGVNGIRDWGYSTNEVDTMLGTGKESVFGMVELTTHVTILNYGDGESKPMTLKIEITSPDSDFGLRSAYSLKTTTVARPE